MNRFRIHGDNIVECERVVNIILKTLSPIGVKSYLISPSTVTIEVKANIFGASVEWSLELLPGFNKNTKQRWKRDIFEALKEAGSFFDETPDIIISEVIDERERILVGMEFCSALQAGNQAWQRSARAFSTGRTGCPYLYIVDFVKYELDNTTRERKNLRFPNAAVPYSYVNYSKKNRKFVAQLYIKSEEFDRMKDPAIASFDESDFGSKDLGLYIVKLMLGNDTSQEEIIILNKNMNVVQFLADHFDSRFNFTPKEWYEVYLLENKDIVDYSIEKKRFGFHKTIATKSHHGYSERIIRFAEELSIGLASRDLPFGIIAADKREEFSHRLAQLYIDTDVKTIQGIGRNEKHLIIAIFKGFKPKGDDNRPDRGLLPLVAMMSSMKADVLTYIYGPIIEKNLKLLDNDPIKLANKNGLWRSILSLSNYVVLDAPVISNKSDAIRGYDAKRVYDTSLIKGQYTCNGREAHLVEKQVFSSIPISYGEDDVDTGIHYLFTHILEKCCFEGMCNPPGGDWSGFSVVEGDYENRWLSLPRVSDVVNGKRPDHILELFGVFQRPLLLSIESKERSVDLEPDVGTKLVTYIKKIMEYVPSAVRQISQHNENWKWGDRKVDFSCFETISAAAYLKKYAEMPSEVFKKNCEILFVMDPIMRDEKIGWDIEIIPSTKRGYVVKEFIMNRYADSGDNQFIIH